MFDHQNKYGSLGEAIFIASFVTFIILLILSVYFFGGSVTFTGLFIIVMIPLLIWIIWDFFRWVLPWIFWAYYTVLVYIFYKVKDKWF